jgi:Ser/Thr protein kinase RdoA (MazF antagonist)
MEEQFKERIKYNGNIKDISLQICKDFNLGIFKANKIVLVGYEDFNYILTTSKGKFFVKIFASFRTNDDCLRYLEIMEKAIAAKVATPKLIKSKNGYLSIIKVNNIKLRLVVFDYIDGNNFYKLNKKLNPAEIKFVARQSALINSIKLKPEPIYDNWAIVNFLKQYNKSAKYLSKEDLVLVKPLVSKFNELNVDKLPKAFVHGDIISTNLMKDKKGKLWIIDFSVSNYYPRIQELAVLACNLFFDIKNKKKSENNFKLALKEYTKILSLTKAELKALPDYIELAHGMHVLCANYEKVKNNNHSKENEYWINEGRCGLKQSLKSVMEKR